MSGPIPTLSAAEVESLVNMAHGDRLAAALWAEFGYGNPDDTGGRPRALDPDDPYWSVAAQRVRELVASLDAARRPAVDGVLDEAWREPVDDLSDSQRLLLLAAWFDMWDRPETDRQAILDDARNPGRNDVQRDLRRIARRAAAIEVAARNVADRRTLDSDGFWVSKKEMNALEAALGDAASDDAIPPRDPGQRRPW